MYEEDRPKFIPRRYLLLLVVIHPFIFLVLLRTILIVIISIARFESLRSVPAYENAVKEGFDRCLDLYLCPRARKKRVS